LRTVEIVAGTTRPEQPPSTQQEPLCLSRLWRPHCHLKYRWARPLQSSTAPGCDLVRLGGGRARLGFCFLSRFLGGFGPVGIQKLAGHGQRVRGWIEAWGKRRVASSSSVIGSGFVDRESNHGGGWVLSQGALIFAIGSERPLYSLMSS